MNLKNQKERDVYLEAQRKTEFLVINMFASLSSVNILCTYYFAGTVGALTFYLIGLNNMIPSNKPGLELKYPNCVGK